MPPTRQSPDLREKYLYSGADFFDDFPEQRLGFGSVEEEILRGAELRLRKPDYRITCDNVGYEMHIATEAEKTKKKKHSKRSNGIQTNPCTPRCCSPQTCRNSPTPTDTCVGDIRSSSSSTHHYLPKKCPLRIAELAQPKKRQCIENIKENTYRLPPIMLERLRQRVNDDRPFVEISDAINCFKLRTPRRPKCVNEWKTTCNNIEKENLKRMEIRSLCVVFGHRIVTKLAVPMTIAFNSELERLSAIVESDISKVMRSKKLISDTIDSDCVKIRKEVADKVTVWMATVLEESKNRLIDEDVQERLSQGTEITGRRSADDIDTVIQNQFFVSLNSLKTSQAEIEEEIGPILDFVDDLVNTVMGSVKTEDNDGDSSIEALDSNKGGTTNIKYVTADSDDDTKDTSSTKLISSANDFYSKTRSIDEGNVEEDIKNIYINDDSVNGLNGLNADRATFNANTNIGNAPEPTQQTDTELNAEPNKVIEHKNVGAEVTSSGLVHNIIEGKGKPDKIQTINSISDVKIVGILQKEDSMDDKNKTVKYSNLDMVIDFPLTNQHDDSIISFSNLIDYKYLPVKKRSIYDSYPLDSELAPPNENLLSQADESWPDDIATLGMTISVNITQSISSLGRIVESDQELADEHVRGEKHCIENTMLITNLNNSNVFNNLNENIQKAGSLNFKYVNLHRASSDNQHDDYESEESHKELPRSEGKVKMNDDNNKDEKSHKELHKNIVLIEKIIQQKNDSENSQVMELPSRNPIPSHIKLAKKNFEKCKGDHKDVEREKSQTMESQQHQTPDKFEYKVKLETAPAWARIPLLTAEDSSNCFNYDDQYKNDINNHEIKKWCKDLDNAYKSLEQWSLWIKAACKEVIELKEKFQDIKKPCQEHYCCRRAKNWSWLKRDIDKDTVLWSKLYQRAHVSLKAYTKKQKQIV